MSQVNTELGRSATATISLNESVVRTLAGVASGSISMSHLRGKSAAPSFTLGFSSSTLFRAGWSYGQSSDGPVGYRFYKNGSITGINAISYPSSFATGTVPDATTVSFVGTGIFYGYSILFSLTNFNASGVPLNSVGRMISWGQNNSINLSIAFTAATSYIQLWFEVNYSGDANGNLSISSGGTTITRELNFGGVAI